MTSEKTKGARTVLRHLVSAFRSPLRHRNYALEFCRHRSLCPISGGAVSDETGEGMPRLTSVTEIIQDVSRDTARGRAARGDTMASASSDEDSGWNYSTNVVNEHLLGWLRASTATGRLQLGDSQGAAMDLVFTSSHSPPAPLHQCGTPCHCDAVQTDQSPPCPYLHPCCVGRLIIVKNFSVVSETFPGIKDGGERGEGVKTLSYIVAAAEDCARLKVRDCRGEGDVKSGRVALRKRAAEMARDGGSGGGGLSSGPHTCLVYITEKCHLSAQVVNSEKRPSFQFCVEGFLVTAKTGGELSLAQDDTEVSGEEAVPAKKKQHAATSTKQQQTMREKSASNVKTDDAALSLSRTGQSVQTHPWCSQSVQAHPSCCQSVQVHPSCCQSVQAHPYCLPRGMEVGQRLSLTFADDGCQWSNLIHPPGLYRVTGKDSASPPLHWPQVDRKLQAAMQRTGTQTAVRVSASAVMEKVFVDCSDQEGHMASVPSLRSALSDRCSGHLFSFRAVVTSRRHLLSQSPELRAPRTVGDLARGGQGRNRTQDTTLAGLLGAARSMCVGVREEGEPSVSTTVYIGASRLACPLGLLPGAVVEFHRLERRTSRASNSYFSFLPVSSLHVLCAPPPTTPHTRHPVKQRSPTEGHGQYGWEDVPVHLLVDQWRHTDLPHVFVAACHVCQFFRLSLKSVCATCGSLYGRGGCSAAACVSNSQSVLLPRISFLVDDGSCQALVSINRTCPDHVARRLLRLSESQWRHLESAIQDQGEVFLQKFGGGGGTAVEDLLSLLCDCSRVKRTCWLLLRKPLYSGKPPAPPPGKKAMSRLETVTAEDLVTRTVNTGEGMVETQCLPYLTLECVDLREL
ncbi:uncharacterized protein LOC143282399 [Babylonia areolata]|uniref:uncharacterized protein LOC143282399 n=1 Tax=Babylonia areolata TaxID=304850 RepID=UPI003FD0BAC6